MVTDHDGEPMGRERLERERAEALAELARIREWLGAVAHDLQQPVAAIRLYVALLERVTGRDPEAAEPVARIAEIARDLDRMIGALSRASP